VSWVILWNVWGKPMLEAAEFETEADAIHASLHSPLNDDGYACRVVEVPRGNEDSD
jgi:hypothetical protein